MRSINTISSQNQEKEDYYINDESLSDEEVDRSTLETKSAVQRMTQAVWHGKGASTLGLEGDVQRKDFKQLFYGYQPGTEERIRGERSNRDTKERLAHDLTLSAPKSFSMAMHLGGDMRLFDIHMEAVKETLDLVETIYAQARVQVNGDRQVVNTGNLIAAIIPHHTSREMDMQLHSHCAIVNGTKCPDGKWRSLWHESIVDAEWLGSYYRQLLAQKVQELGYEIYETQLEKGHSFEISAYTREQIEEFSKRSRQIVESLQKRGLEVNAESRDRAVLTTRKTKRIEETLVELQTRWRAEAGVMEIDRPTPQHCGVKSLGHGSAQEELESAIRHLSERSVSFSLEDIYQYVFDRTQTFGIEDLNWAIARHKELLPIGRRFTTVEAIERETKTVKAWMSGQGKTNPIMSEAAVISELEGIRLNCGQATVVAKTLSAVDQHLVIHGLSGVGKTTAMRELKRLIEKSEVDVNIRGYSPTIKAAKILQESLGIETNTVESLVLKDPETVPNQLWIVDEAGMVSARQMEIVLDKANAVGARILLVGDTKQNPSVEAGSPMRSLMDYGATTFSLREIIRQKNEVQKRAVELIADGYAANALGLLVEHGYVQEIAERRDRTQAIALQWLSLSAKERDETLIVTGTNAERLAINQALRQGLRAEGNLGEDHQFKQLVNRQLTAEQKQRFENYHKGDLIKLTRDYKSTPLKKGKLYQVVGIRDRQLLVETEGGRLFWFDPSRYKDKEVFGTQDIAIAAGDRLRWKVTDKKARQINGTEFIVKAIDGKRLTVVDENGKEETVNGAIPLGVDYANVSTAYSAQGFTAQRVIVAATNSPTSAQEPFYVKISRQTKDIKVYVEDLGRLHEWVQKSVAQENPLELIGEHYDQQRRSFIGSDRLIDTEHGRIKSPERGSHEGEQELTDIYATAVEHHPVNSEADVRRFHNSVQGSSRRTEIRSNERSDQRASRGNEQSFNQTRGYEHGTTSGQTGGDVSLRRNYGQQAANYSQQRELIDRTILGWSTDEQWTEALTDLTQLVQLVNARQIFKESGLTPKLAALTQKIENLNSEPRQYHFEGLSELAAALTQQKSESNLVTGLAQIQTTLSGLTQALAETGKMQQLEAIDSAIKQWRSEQFLAASVLQSRFDEVMEAAALIDDLRPETQQLVEAIHNWQSEQEVSVAFAKVNEVVQQLEQGQTFDFSALAEVLNSADKEQLLTETGLDVGFADLTQQLEKFNLEEPIQFKDMSKLVESLQSVQVNSRLVETGLTDRLATLTQQISHLNSEPDRYKFEGIAEIAQMSSQQQTQIPLSATLAEIAELALKLERQEAIASLAQTVNSFNTRWQFQDSGLLEQLRAMSERVIGLNKKIINYEFKGMNKLASAVYERHAAEAISEHLQFLHSSVERVDELVHIHPQLQQLAKTVRSLRSNQVFADGVGAEQLQQVVEKLRSIGLNTTPQPQTLKSFWHPVYSNEPPTGICWKHWQEFKQSAIHPQLIALNAKSIAGRSVLERLLSDRLQTMGSGQFVTVPMAKLIERYEQVAEGGWWGNAGVDARSLLTLQPGTKPALNPWGCFKPDNPRINEQKTQHKGETHYIKYEHPVGVARSPYLPEVPDELAERIYAKYGVKPTLAERASGFWYVVYQHREIPIAITEGWKKTLSSLSQGEVTIGVSGVNALYLANDQEKNRLPQRQLNEELAVFATPGREFKFAFDQDTKASTVMNVRRDLVRSIELLEARGCICKVVKWDSNLSKGLDDLIVNQGALAYTRAQLNTVPSEGEKKAHYLTQYKLLAKITQEERQLSQVHKDVEIYLLAVQRGELMDGDRFLTQSDRAQTLDSLEQVQAYVDQIKAIAPQYAQQKYTKAARKWLEKEQVEAGVISSLLAQRIEFQDVTSTNDANEIEQERLNKRALKLSIRLLSEFGKQQNSDRVSWTGGWYTFTKTGSNVKIDCNQRQATILKLSDGNLQGSITQRDVDRFERVLEAIREKEIVEQVEL